VAQPLVVRSQALHEQWDCFRQTGLTDDAQQDSPDAVITLSAEGRNQLCCMRRGVCLQFVADNVHQAAPDVSAAEQLDAFRNSGEVGMLPLPAGVDGIVQLLLSNQSLSRNGYSRTKVSLWRDRDDNGDPEPRSANR